MGASSHKESPVEEGREPSAGPDWNLVPFEVGCARCGHDLHGLSEPKCPACSLEFDWAQAVPIERLTCLHCDYHLYGLRETRCPECGRAFSWERVLDDYHRRRKPLFEYHWRKRPVRSFVKSWWLAMRPWKLWRLIEIHDPPARDGINMLLLLSALLFALAPVAVAYAGGWAIDAIEGLAALGPRGWSWLGGTTRFYYGLYLGPWDLRSGGVGNYWLRTIVPLVCWSAGTLGALLLLRQSMGLCKVRNSHVVRAWTYALLPVMSGPALFCIFAFVWDASVIWWRPGGSWTFRMNILLLQGFGLFLMLWPLLSLAIAYRRYIKMKHGWGVAFASLAIGWFLAGIVSIRLQL